MLLLRRDMLLPEGMQESLITFMDAARDVGENDGHSKHRYTIVQDVGGDMRYFEGYLCYHSSGEMRYRANTCSYSHQIHLYAWDKVIALLPANKRVKEIWLHPRMEYMLPTLNFSNYYYGKLYQTRIQECLKISQQI